MLAVRLSIQQGGRLAEAKNQSQEENLRKGVYGRIYSDRIKPFG
jgi:hypothetical protein